MSRQDENNRVKKILNKKEAMNYLGLSRKIFDAIIKQGDLSFKVINRNKYFPVWVLDKWLSSTVNHLDCSKEAKYTTPTSRSYPKDNEFALENLLEQMTSKQRQSTASNVSQKYRRASLTHLARRG